MIIVFLIAKMKSKWCFLASEKLMFGVLKCKYFGIRRSLKVNFVLNHPGIEAFEKKFSPKPQRLFLIIKSFCHYNFIVAKASEQTHYINNNLTDYNI